LTISVKNKKWLKEQKSKFQVRYYDDSHDSITGVKVKDYEKNIHYLCSEQLNKSNDTEKTLQELSKIFIIDKDMLEILLWERCPNKCKEWFEEPLFINSAMRYRSLSPESTGLDPDLKNSSYEEITPSEILQGIIRLSAGGLARLGSPFHDDLLLNWIDSDATKDIDKDSLLSTYVILVRRELILKVEAYCMIEDLMNYHLDDGFWEIHTVNGDYPWKEKEAKQHHKISIADSVRGEFDSNHRTKIVNKLMTNESAIKYQVTQIFELIFLLHTTPSFVLKRAILFPR